MAGSPSPVRSSAHFATMIASGKLVNHYQPIIDMRTGMLGSLETLGRLQQGDRLIPPGDFLPFMDTAALEALLFASLRAGLTVLKPLLARWPALNMSFNVNPQVVLLPGFAAKLLDALAADGVPPRLVCLEILECEEFPDLAAARSVLGDLARHGLHLALDDVGTGYSSLARLQALPVTVMKLDQCFTRPLPRQPENLHVVASMVALARGLNKFLVVEGVETDDIMQALLHVGVAYVQGYAIARPMPASALTLWTQARIEQPHPAGCDSLLSAYAMHITLVDACLATAALPLRPPWQPAAGDPRIRAVADYLARSFCAQSELRQAQARFQSVVDSQTARPADWMQAAEALSATLLAAIHDPALQRSGTPLPTAARSGATIAQMVAAEQQ